MNFRNFTKTDWYGFAGCESWDDNNPPLIGETDKWLVVCDKQGVEIYESAADCDDEGRTMRLNLEFPTSFAAAAFLRGLPLDFDPALYGFELLHC